MLNAIMCTFLQNTRTKLEENILTNRQTEKASKQDKQTITSTSKGTGVRRGEGGMLSFLGREGDAYELLLVVLVAKGGICISILPDYYCFYCYYSALALNCRQ